MINEALDAKLRESGALFEAQVLIRCRAVNRAGAKAAMQRVLGGFEIFGAQNWFRARGVSILGLAFFGSDRPPLRRSFDRRMDSGRFRPGAADDSHRQRAGRLPEAAERSLQRRQRRSRRHPARRPAEAADLRGGQHGSDPARPRRRQRQRADRRRAHRRHLLLLHRRTLALRQDRAGRRPVRPRRALRPRRPLPRSSRRCADADQALPARAGAAQQGGRNRPRPGQLLRLARVEPLRAGRRRRRRGAGRGDRRRLLHGAGVGRAIDAGDQPHHPGRHGAGLDRQGAARRAGADDLPAPHAALRRALACGCHAFPAAASQRFWETASRCSPPRRLRR